MKKLNIKKVCLGAVFCAAVFVSTLISVPVGTFGNVNLGDSMILICSFFLGYYGILPASIGASLCDVLNGYGIYAPGTFIIKALIVIVVTFFMKAIKNKKASFILSSILGEAVMVLGYFIYEAMVLSYGFGAYVNIPFNMIQGFVCILVGVFLYSFLKRYEDKLIK